MRKATLLLLLLISGIVAAQDVKILNLKSNGLTYLPSTDRLYVSTPEGGSHGNSLCVVNPYHGTVDTCYAISGSPGVLAASDDEKYIYIGLETLPEIVRFDVDAGAVGQRFYLGSASPFYGPNFAEDITVMPGSPKVIAVSLMSQLVSPKHTGVAIFDDGARRPFVTSVHTGSNSIAFDPATGLLYGYNNESSEFGLRKMAVDAEGVSVLSVTEGLFYKFADEIEYAEGNLYSSLGQVIDISGDTPTLAGQFDADYSISSAGMEAAPDSNVVYFLNSSYFNALILQTFDKNSYRLIGEQEFPNLGGYVRQLVNWGSDGKLAFISKDNINNEHNKLVILRNCTSTITEPLALEQIPGVCPGDTLTFHATTGLGPIFWSNGQVGPTAIVTSPGSIYYQVADEQGCLSSPSNLAYAQFDYQVSAPYIQVPGSLALCQNGQVNLTTPAYPGSFGFVWSNGEEGEMITVTEPGMYSVQALSLNGCLSEPSEAVTVFAIAEPAPSQPSIVIQGEAVHCESELTQLLAPEGYPGYLWSNGSTSPSIMPYLSGLYNVQVINEQGCLSRPSDPVEVFIKPNPPTPDIFLSNDNFLYANIPFDTGIQWLLNGEPIPGATSQVLEVTETGTYNMQITWDGCSSVSNELYVVISSSDELANQAKPALFPNPASDKVYLRLSALQDRQGMAHIRSMEGKLLRSQVLTAGQGVQELSLSGLPAGLYVVEAFDGKGFRLMVSRLVIE